MAGFVATLFAAAPTSADIPVMTFDEYAAEEFKDTFAVYQVADPDGEIALRDLRFIAPRSTAWLGEMSRTSLFDDAPLAAFSASFDEPKRLMGSIDFSVTDAGFSSETSDGGPVIETVIPAPGAVVLGVFGLGAVGCWVKRRMS
jgi:hypothetical protein